MALVVACDEMVCGCPPVDPSALAYVEGTVVDSTSAPVPGVSVEPTGVVGFDCSFDDRSAFAEHPAVTDATGAFEQLVSVFLGPGTHCVEFSVRDSVTPWADTVFSDPIPFRHHSEAPETTTTVLRVSR